MICFSELEVVNSSSMIISGIFLSLTPPSLTAEPNYARKRPRPCEGRHLVRLCARGGTAGAGEFSLDRFVIGRHPFPNLIGTGSVAGCGTVHGSAKSTIKSLVC